MRLPVRMERLAHNDYALLEADGRFFGRVDSRESAAAIVAALNAGGGEGKAASEAADLAWSACNELIEAVRRHHVEGKDADVVGALRRLDGVAAATKEALLHGITGNGGGDGE